MQLISIAEIGLHKLQVVTSPSGQATLAAFTLQNIRSRASRPLYSAFINCTFARPRMPPEQGSLEIENSRRPRVLQ